MRREIQTHLLVTMDPLSIIASSVAIIHGVRKTLEVVQKLRRCKSELFALHNEVTDLAFVLGELRTYLQVRASATNPLPPNLKLLECLCSLKAKLDFLAIELDRWSSHVDSTGTSASGPRFKVVRIAQKARKFKDDMKCARDQLSALLALFTA